MKLKFVLCLLINLIAINLFSQSIDDIQKNLEKRLTGKKEDIQYIASLIWKLNFIANTKPVITITPQSIIVTKSGKVILGEKRIVDIDWKPTSSTNSILKIKATLAPQLVKYQDPSRDKFGFIGGMSYLNDHLDGILMFTYSFLEFWRFSLFVGAGYPGGSAGLSFKIYDNIDISAGIGFTFSKEPSGILFIGFNSRIF